MIIFHLPKRGPVRLMVLITILIAIAMLAGCETVPVKPEIVYRNKFVEIPKELLKRCDSSKPPARKDYVETDDARAKEKMLTDFSIAQTNVIRKCGDTIDSIGDWNEKQKKIYAEPAK